MEGKAKYIFPIIMAFFMTFLMTAVITFINLGFPAHYFNQWAKAFIAAWPLASLVAFLAVPMARRITTILVNLIDGA